MKIATWNIERLRHRARLGIIETLCEQANADILVLTETDASVKLNYKYCYKTPFLRELAPKAYTPMENRVSIYTNYKCKTRHATFDKQTALCVELETERGNLLVYGTTIGIYGNRHRGFAEELAKQLVDIKRLSSDNQNLCVCGDFNCSFADSYYYTKSARRAITESFSENNLALLTKNRPECIDHIAVSYKFVADSAVQIEEWNTDKKLSDHKGIIVSL
ncbi:MAG: endonuclease/exonuclease/phosphatase family protein [Oscillospiraceae bacterium]|jgi:endonuclease/exonuclease/phosphatase family metal-dependent hydrolase|nr:endonuclease/exonuclease/phosphatase family protein [Oscillospiraceae bacterium]